MFATPPAAALGRRPSPRLLVKAPPGREPDADLLRALDAVAGATHWVASFDEVRLQEWDAALILDRVVDDPVIQRLRCLCPGVDAVTDRPLQPRTTTVVPGFELVRPDVTADADGFDDLIGELARRLVLEPDKRVLEPAPPFTGSSVGLSPDLGRVVHREQDLLAAPAGAVVCLRRSFESEEPVGEAVFLTYDLDAAETVAWLRACFRRWRRDAPAAFPLDRWIRSPRWSTPTERRIAAAVADLERERDDAARSHAAALAARRGELERAAADGDDGPRRLLTADGPDLVEEVARTLRRLGFSATAAATGPSATDGSGDALLIGDPARDGWTAVIAVQGSTGPITAADAAAALLGPAQRFIVDYGREPSALWFVANPERDLDPALRTRPTAEPGQPIVIWTVDLFDLLDRLDRDDLPPVAARPLLSGAAVPPVPGPGSEPAATTGTPVPGPGSEPTAPAEAPGDGGSRPGVSR